LFFSTVRVEVGIQTKKGGVAFCFFLPFVQRIGLALKQLLLLVLLFAFCSLLVFAFFFFYLLFAFICFYLLFFAPDTELSVETVEFCSPPAIITSWSLAPQNCRPIKNIATK
jgi:hypothetical protein